VRVYEVKCNECGNEVPEVLSKRYNKEGWAGHVVCMRKIANMYKLKGRKLLRYYSVANGTEILKCKYGVEVWTGLKWLAYKY
jgi:hypothetical protein